ncbi:SRP40, C-terminal domain-containing protein, partial [Russula compacta]
AKSPSSSDSSSSSDSDSDEASGPPPTAKQRASEDGTAVITATTATTPAGNARAGRASRNPNTPFQRVNAQTVKYVDEKLKDNSFESRVCVVLAQGARTDDYGARASRDLIVTRGDGFRKEKNKKKRGSYRGGDITLHSHSFKFED